MSTSTLSLSYWTVAMQGPNSMIWNCLNHCGPGKVFGLASSNCHYSQHRSEELDQLYRIPKFRKGSTPPHGTINILFPNAFFAVTVTISTLVGDEEWTKSAWEHSKLHQEMSAPLVCFLTAPAVVVCCSWDAGELWL